MPLFPKLAPTLTGTQYKTSGFQMKTSPRTDEEYLGKHEEATFNTPGTCNYSTR